MKLNKLVLTILTVSSLLVSCNDRSEKQESAVRNVILSNVEVKSDIISKTYPGIVEEGKSVNAAFMTGGKISALYVKDGERVRKGQLLATLDDSDYKIGVGQLEAQYNQMKAEKERMDEMYALHNIAPNDYEKFEAGFKQLQLQLEMANNKLEYTRLYSPSDGFISYKYMQPGELVDAGTPIYKITDDSHLEVSVDLPLSIFLDRSKIKSCMGIVPGISEDIPLTISSFTPDADNNQLYNMILDMPSSFGKELTTGMNINVIIELANAIEGESVIPSRSIYNLDGGSYVWIYNENDSTISRKHIKVIGQPIDKKSIVTGLQGKEKIVSVGVKQLKDGEKVNIIPNPVH